MKPHTFSRRSVEAGVSLVLLCLLVGFVTLVSGCGKDRISPPNQPPHVTVTGGPPQGSATYYWVTISWVGWDSDGVVKYFLYAIDDSTSWTEIRTLEETFLFSADSLREGEEFGRWHTFWIKAVDNDGARSLPDYLTFDARTVAPKTTIIMPSCDVEGQYPCQGPLILGTTVTCVWEGEDPDSRDPAKEPVAYQWRLLNLTALYDGSPPYYDPSMLERVLIDTPEYMPDSSSFWSEPSAETEVTLTGLEPATYVFGVRAIDEAGAVEPYFRVDHNVILFFSMSFGGPVLCVYQDAAGHCFPGDGQVWERQVRAGVPLDFTWEGDASAYGGTISGYRYGVDIDDLNDPYQWETSWGPDIKSATVEFAEPGVHYLYVEVMDYAGAVQLATVQLNVGGLFERDILYVDDYYDIIPDDLFHDNFRDAILTRARQLTDSIYVFNCWLPGPNNVPRELYSKIEYPSLAELTRYRLVIWDTDAGQNGFVTGIWNVVFHGILQAYLLDGGRLWIFGRQIVRGTDREPSLFTYGSVPDELSFAAKFLKLSGVVNRPVVGGSNIGDGFRRGIPNRALSDRIPTLDIDYSAGGTSPDYGMSKIEAVMTAMQEPDLSQRPDTLYFYGANYETSQYQLKPCALRFHNIHTGSKVVYMGFPIHYFFKAQAESLATFVTEWMFGVWTIEDVRPGH